MHLFTLTKILNIQIVFNIFGAFYCSRLVIQLFLLYLHNEIVLSLFSILNRLHCIVCIVDIPLSSVPLSSL